MEEIAYHVTVAGGGLTLERDVPKDLGEHIVVLVLYGLAGRPDAAAVTPYASRNLQAPADSLVVSSMTTDQTTPDDELTSAEFIGKSGASSYPEKITAIVYFYKKYRGVQSFTRDQLSTWLKQAGAGAPKNLVRDLGTAQERMWVAVDENQPGSFRLTKTGTGAVESGFSSDVGRKPARRRRGSGNGRRPKDAQIEPLLTATTSTDEE
jgi:hypothetical protein